MSARCAAPGTTCQYKIDYQQVQVPKPAAAWDWSYGAAGLKVLHADGEGREALPLTDHDSQAGCAAIPSDSCIRDLSPPYQAPTSPIVGP